MIKWAKDKKGQLTMEKRLIVNKHISDNQMHVRCNHLSPIWQRPKIIPTTDASVSGKTLSGATW